MTDAEDCPIHLRRFADEPDTPEARKKINGWIDDYHYRGGVRVELAAAFENEHPPDTTLTTFIRRRLASPPRE